MTRIIMAKPIRALEFHYPIIQFLIHGNSCGHTTDFYLGKTDLPRANSSKISQGKFISGFVLTE